MMDSLTANSEVVLESLGGEPTMRETLKERMEEATVNDGSADVESQIRRRSKQSLE